MTLRNILITTTAVSCLLLPGSGVAASTAPIITYTASGTFAATAVSGADTLKLAGEPFSVTISVSSATKPYKTGKNWADYNKLKLTGSVHSGLLGSTPVNIASAEASITQAINPGQGDQFTMQAPVKVVGISLTLKAVINMPAGTIAKPLLAPFGKAVALSVTDATLTYAESTTSTVLDIQSGSLTATIPAAAAAAVVTLHANGAQALTLQADGTTTAQSIAAGPVDLGFGASHVALQFYAAGVSGASEVHVQIAGEEVPVVYAGASGYFPGLDEVIVQAPASLIGRGATTVTLTADGESAAPVAIRIR